MFCKYCGNQIPDGSEFCPACGNDLREAPTAPPVQQPYDNSGQGYGYDADQGTQVLSENDMPAYQQQNYQQQPYQQPMYQQPADQGAYQQQGYQQQGYQQGYDPNAYQQPQFATPNFEAPKKKKSGGKIVAILLALVVVIGVAGFFLLGKGGSGSGIGGGKVDGIKIESANEFQKAESASLSVLTAEISKFYGTALSNSSKQDGAAEGSIKLNIGDDALNLANQVVPSLLGKSINLDFLKTIEFGIDSNVKDNVAQILLAAKINGKTLADADVILDMNKSEVMFAIKSLNDKYLKASLGDDLDLSSNEAYALLTSGRFQKALPTQAELNTLLNRYLGIVLTNLKDFDKTTEMVQIGNISQELNVLKVKITDEVVLNIAKDVLTTLKTDKDVKKLIENLVVLMAEVEGDAPDAAEVYKDFLETIDEALEELQDAELGLGESVALTDYVDDKGIIVGRDLEVMGMKVIHMLSVRNADKIAYEASIPAANVTATGEGTNVNGAITADIELNLNNNNIGTFKFIDFKAGDKISGKMRFAPSFAILQQIGINSAITSALSIANPEIEIALSDGTVEFNVISSDKVFVGLALSFKEKNASAIKVPSADMITEDEDEWAEGLDPQKLLDAIKNVGLPNELVTMLEQAVFGGMAA